MPSASKISCLVQFLEAMVMPFEDQNNCSCHMMPSAMMEGRKLISKHALRSHAFRVHIPHSGLASSGKVFSSACYGNKKYFPVSGGEHLPFIMQISGIKS